MRTMRLIIARLPWLPFLIIPGSGLQAAEPAATPQRPSVSFGTTTVPEGRWELEGGGIVADGGSALPLFLKYGLRDDLELELGLDAVRQVEQEMGTRSSLGDFTVGLRTRPWERDESSTAFVGWVKVPTANDGVGTGKLDAGIVGVFSTPAKKLSLDTNLWLTGLKREDGTILGQVQLVATLGFPLRGCWSSFAEVALQNTATEGDGGFIDAGLACAVGRASVIDMAAGGGWSDGYPGWSLTVGWTRLLSRSGFRRSSGAVTPSR